MNILYVTPYVPSAIRLRPYNLIRALNHMGHHITLLTAASTSPDEQEQARELRGWGVHVEAFPVPVIRSMANCLRAIPTREPLQAVFSYHPQMQRRLSQLLDMDGFDVVHIEHLRAARLVRTVSKAPVVYDSVDCISLLFEQVVQSSHQLRSRLMTGLDLARTRRYEAGLLTSCDHVVITSQRDKEAMEGLARRYLPPDADIAPIDVVTNGVDLGYFRPTQDMQRRDERTVIFTGKMSYHANISAVMYFAEDILPRVWAQDPKVRFQIVGKAPPEAIRKLEADSRIQVTGYVDSLRPFLSRATVAVCPVPYAVGVQNKVLEAMAMETPVVCTPAAFAGLEAEEEKDIMVADTPDAFAEQILRICSDPALATRLGAAGRQYVTRHHSWEASAQRLVEAYENASIKAVRGRAHRKG